MIISLLPVLPPDLRPIISNARGYITGDINLHYQNIVYRNNMIERLSNAFWIPKKLVSIKKIYEQFNYPGFYDCNIENSFSDKSSMYLRKHDNTSKEFIPAAPPKKIIRPSALLNKSNLIQTG